MLAPWDWGRSWFKSNHMEAIGLVWACGKFHQYIYNNYSQCFELMTDQKRLRQSKPPSTKSCARIERWVLRLQPSEFKAIHLPVMNNIADPLS